MVDESIAAGGTLAPKTCAFEINVGADDVYLSRGESPITIIDAGFSEGKYYAVSSGTYKLDHYKGSSGVFVDSTSTCTLVAFL